MTKIKIPLIAGNWKMNKTTKEASAFVWQLKRKMVSIKKVEVLICPPFTALYSVVETAKGSNIHVGAQNMYKEAKGAYTGEISAQFLADLGCQYVILGHSERRRYFGETDILINKKVLTAFKFGLTPILCLGEKLSAREKNQTFQIIKHQLEIGLDSITNIKEMVIAYEPLWAIGTGKTAMPKQIREVNTYIRKFISQKYGQAVSLNLRILYGGSVKPDNISSLITEEEIDGVLIGGASLEVESFFDIIKLTNDLTD